ncbi:hypothetical protein ACKGJI_09515 [Sulfurospirillum sp. 1307]|jgi:hypothetical protein
MNKFSLHVDTFKYWLDNFNKISFDIEKEDLEDTKAMLNKLVQNQDIDQYEIELLYTLSLDNATMQKNDFIKFQAKKLVNFINEKILTNINKELL